MGRGCDVHDQQVLGHIRHEHGLPVHGRGIVRMLSKKQQQYKKTVENVEYLKKNVLLIKGQFHEIFTLTLYLRKTNPSGLLRKI